MNKLAVVFAGDSMSIHNGMKFTTIDKDNDEYVEGNCAQTHYGGWWYRSCHPVNLNGEMGNDGIGKGIIWNSWRGYEYSLTGSTIMIQKKLYATEDYLNWSNTA